MLVFCYGKLIDIIRDGSLVLKSDNRNYITVSESYGGNMEGRSPDNHVTENRSFQNGDFEKNSMNSRNKEGQSLENKDLGDQPANEENVEWNLILVNRTHPVDEDYIAGITLTPLINGQSVDSRCYPDLQKMMDDCRAEGYSPVITSSFRTYQRQTDIFHQQVLTYMNQGMDRQTAEAETAKSVAIPGTSEHELGIAVDITDMDDQRVISGMEEQPVQRWLMENSWRYGFILRYPVDKSDITGIVYEPWHYRYVGYEAAKYIYENEMTLEEYVAEKQIFS